MIVNLGGLSLKEARKAAHRFIERTSSVADLETPKPRKVPAAAVKIERARMRMKVKATVQLRAAVLEAVNHMRDAFFEAGGLREAEDPRARLQRLLKSVDSMSPDELAAAIHDMQKQVYEAGAQSAQAEVGVSLDLKPERALDEMYHHTLRFSRLVVDREKVAVKNAILQGMDAGESVDEIAQRIRDSFDDGMHIIDEEGGVARIIPADTWAEIVARSEVARAESAGVIDTYRDAGVTQMMFVAAEDERTCPECEDLDGTIMEIDSEDAPPVHASCRCTTIAIMEEDTGDSGGDDSSDDGSDDFSDQAVA